MKNGELVYLTQTDTTVGFLSQSARRLADAKMRPLQKKFLQAYATLGELKESHRIPNSFKRELRRAKKRTFVVKGDALRLVSEKKHRDFLRRFAWLYSTSANRSGDAFDREYACTQADVVVEDARGFIPQSASQILKINNKRGRRLR